MRVRKIFIFLESKFLKIYNIAILRNYVKCKYMFMFLQNDLVCKLCQLPWQTTNNWVVGDHIYYTQQQVNYNKQHKHNIKTKYQTRQK